MPIKFKAVTAETKRLIDIGDRVIRECRALVGIPVTEPGKPEVNLSNGPVRVCAQCFKQITDDGLGG